MIFSHFILGVFLIIIIKQRLCLYCSKRIKFTHILTRPVYYPNAVYNEKAMSEIFFTYPSSNWDNFQIPAKYDCPKFLGGDLAFVDL